MTTQKETPAYFDCAQHRLRRAWQYDGMAIPAPRNTSGAGSSRGDNVKEMRGYCARERDFTAVGIAIRACDGEHGNPGGYGDDGGFGVLSAGAFCAFTF